jgi:hypothetical protein
METTIEAVEKCTSKAVGIDITGKDEDGNAEAASLMASLNEYFSIFAKPTGKCLKCGTTLGGLLGWAMGGFRWGLAWGEGNCGCGWPARAYHEPKDTAGEKIFDRPLQMILQYHPDNVASRTSEETPDDN